MGTLAAINRDVWSFWLTHSGTDTGVVKLESVCHRLAKPPKVRLGIVSNKLHDALVHSEQRRVSQVLT